MDIRKVKFSINKCFLNMPCLLSHVFFRCFVSIWSSSRELCFCLFATKIFGENPRSYNNWNRCISWVLIGQISVECKGNPLEKSFSQSGIAIFTNVDLL